MYLTRLLLLLDAEVVLPVEPSKLTGKLVCQARKAVPRGRSKAGPNGDLRGKVAAFANLSRGCGLTSVKRCIPYVIHCYC